MRFYSSTISYTFVVETVPEKKVTIKNNSTCMIRYLSDGVIKDVTGRIVDIYTQSDRIILDASTLYKFSEVLISIDNIIDIEMITY